MRSGFSGQKWFMGFYPLAYFPLGIGFGLVLPVVHFGDFRVVNSGERSCTVGRNSLV